MGITIGMDLHAGKKAGANYCAAAKALFATWPTGQSAAVKKLINEKIMLWQAYGIFQKFDALWFPILANEADGRKNWIKNAHHLTPMGIAWAAKVGYTGDNVATYVKSGFIESQGVNYKPADGNSLCGVMSGAMTTVGNNECLIGGSGGKITEMLNNTVARTLCYINNTGSIFHNNNTSVTMPILKSMGRNDLDNGYMYFQNSVNQKVMELAHPYQGLCNVQLYFHAYNNQDVSAINFTDNNAWMYYFSSFLTNAEHTYLYNEAVDFKAKLSALI